MLLLLRQARLERALPAKRVIWLHLVTRPLATSDDCTQATFDDQTHLGFIHMCSDAADIKRHVRLRARFV